MKRIFLLLIILLCIGVPATFAQSRMVTGRVLDDKGEPVTSAGITVKGTTVGTVSDFDGNFKLDAPGDATTLVVQGLGFNTQEVPITNGMMTVRLTSQSKVLNETVVTALGISREKRSLGYTQSIVTSDAIDKSGEQNTIQALAGKSAGILVTGSGGTPGASSQILLRGNSNISGGVSSPLFVVDGIPIDNGTSQPVAGDYPFDQNLTGVNESNRGIDLNPNDIESVTILRGPAAAALYGIRGANGALIITTKKGKAGKGAKRLGIDFSSNTEISYVNKLPEMQKKYLQGTGGTFNPTSNQSWGARADTTNIKTYDKYKDFFQTGESYVNNVGITWSGDKSAFRVGLGNTKTTGIVPNSQFKRTTINMHADAQLSSFLRVGADMNYTNSEGRRVQNGSNLSGIMLSLLRAPINYDVNNIEDPLTKTPNNYFAAYDNPKWTAQHNPYTDQTNRIFGNINFSLDLAKGLTLTDRLGLDAYATNARQVYDIYSNGNDNADGSGQVNFYNANSVQIYNDLILRYDKQLTEDVSLTSLIGFNYTFFDNKSTFTRGRNLQLPNIYTLNNTNSHYGSNTEDYLRMQGLFGEATFGYKSRLYLTVTGRNDWVSYYGRNGMSFFYPKADMSYIFSENIGKSDVLTFGKLRAAFADAGKGPDRYLNPSSPYTAPFITDGSTNGVSFPYLGQSGYAPSNVLLDVNVKPEHTESKEIGIETRWFRNRVGLNITYYSQLTKDAIIPLPIAQSTGYSVYVTNGGTARNRGIEVEFNADVVKNKNLTWNVFANFTRDRSRVMSINPQVSEVSVGSGFSDIGSYSIVGEPIGVFYGTTWERDSTTGKILIDAQGRAIKSDVAKKIGNPNPDWTMGIGSNLTYKGLSFSFLWDIRKGGDVWNGTWARLTRLGLTDETQDRERTYVIDGVYAPGTPNAGQQNVTPVSSLYYYQTYKGDLGNYAAENSIQDGGWVRLRSVNLSYRFQFNQEKSKYINYLEIGVTGRNLLLFTKYKGVDPETSLTGASSSLRGYDYFNNPGTKSYMLNVRLGL